MPSIIRTAAALAVVAGVAAAKNSDLPEKMTVGIIGGTSILLPLQSHSRNISAFLDLHNLMND